MKAAISAPAGCNFQHRHTTRSSSHARSDSSSLTSNRFSALMSTKKQEKAPASSRTTAPACTNYATMAVSLFGGSKSWADYAEEDDEDFYANVPPLPHLDDVSQLAARNSSPSSENLRHRHRLGHAPWALPTLYELIEEQADEVAKEGEEEAGENSGVTNDSMPKCGPAADRNINNSVLRVHAKREKNAHECIQTGRRRTCRCTNKRQGCCNEEKVNRSATYRQRQHP